MRIGIVSTYPPIECGIATYTSYLAEALMEKKYEIHIVSQHGASGINVYPTFNADDSDLPEKVFNVMLKVTPDVVHIQHEFGLYGKQFGMNIIPLVYKFRMAGIPIVVTLHTVYKNPQEMTREQLIVLESLTRNADAVIVHEKFQKQVLHSLYKVGKKTYVIPHGVRIVDPYPDAKEKLGLSGKKVVLLCGYFRPTKGFHKIVKVFPEVVDQVPDAVLVIAGKVRMIEYSEYRNMFFQLIDSSPVKDKIRVFRGQFPQKTFDYILSSADVVPFPYDKGAQSGVMAHTLAFGKPVVTSELESFKNAVEKIKCGFVAKTEKEYAKYICKILKDEDLRKEISSNIKKYVKKYLAWGIIAEQTAELYKNIAAIPYKDSEYIYIP